jgi:hypothetical protein
MGDGNVARRNAQDVGDATVSEAPIVAKVYNSQI